MSEEGSAIRRRRSCPQCAYRFTTYERLEEVPLHVLKRSGGKEPFDRAKMIAGIQAAVKGRPVDALAIIDMAERIEDKLRLKVNEIIAQARKAGDIDKMSQKWLGRPAGDLPL